MTYASCLCDNVPLLLCDCLPTCSYLPHVLQKIDRVSFGLMNKGDYARAIKSDPHMPRTRAKLAIPFVGKDVPSKSSEFAHPDVIIGLTILAYRWVLCRSTPPL